MNTLAAGVTYPSNGSHLEKQRLSTGRQWFRGREKREHYNFGCYFLLSVTAKMLCFSYSVGELLICMPLMQLSVYFHQFGSLESTDRQIEFLKRQVSNSSLCISVNTKLFSKEERNDSNFSTSYFSSCVIDSAGYFFRQKAEEIRFCCKVEKLIAKL